MKGYVTACAWEYPQRRSDGTLALCQAPGKHEVLHRVHGTLARRCVNHAMRDVWGGQWEYTQRERESWGRPDGL